MDTAQRAGGLSLCPISELADGTSKLFAAPVNFGAPLCAGANLGDNGSYADIDIRRVRGGTDLFSFPLCSAACAGLYLHALWHRSRAIATRRKAARKSA